MNWYIITCRLDGQDEDSLYVVQARTARRAVERVEKERREESGNDQDTPFYVNKVVQCDTEPTVLHWPF